MTKLRLKMLTGLCGLLLLPGLLPAQNRFARTPVDADLVSAVVLETRISWMNMLPWDDLLSFGFESVGQLSLSIPGQPVPVFQQFKNSQGEMETRFTSSYLVPLILNNEIRMFLTVAFFEEKYQVVAAGEKNLAQEATEFLINSTAHPLWLQNLNQAADFISYADDQTAENDMEFFPLSTARRASFSEPVKFPELIRRMVEMPVQNN